MALPAGWKVLTPNEATTFLKMAGEVQKGKRRLPPEIVEIKKRIATATRNAELFTARLRQVDQGMVYEIVQLRLEYDRLLGEWAKSETKAA